MLNDYKFSKHPSPYTVVFFLLRPQYLLLRLKKEEGEKEEENRRRRKDRGRKEITQIKSFGKDRVLKQYPASYLTFKQASFPGRKSGTNPELLIAFLSFNVVSALINAIRKKKNTHIQKENMYFYLGTNIMIYL